MQNFSKFYFHKFEFDKSSLEAKFYYSFDNEVFFEEIINFSSEHFNFRDNIDYEIVNNLLFQIHIALGISYYKAYPTSKLVVESGFLEQNQVDFWVKFYKNGLGEFLFTNKINPKNLFNFINSSDNNIKYIKKDFTTKNRSLVALGGGKDSIVSTELLNNAGVDFDLCVFGKNDILKENVAKIAGKKILLIKRKISPELFSLNDLGYYNGHVPITGIIAFILELTAYLYDYKYLVLSNEKSANFGNTTWKGLDINHQYSKSLEFEIDFKNYVETYISGNIKYFSLLRGFYEIKIAEIFAKLGKKYFGVFSSCNNNFKILKTSPHPSPLEEREQASKEKNVTSFSPKGEGIQGGGFWCNSCPKCLFVFSILRPFLDTREVLQIFGEDLYENKNLEKMYKELLGIDGIKPFECVGEADEVLFSMYKSIEKYPENKLPYILKTLKKQLILDLNNEVIKNIEKKLVPIDEEDIIPFEFKKLIFKNN